MVFNQTVGPVHGTEGAKLCTGFISDFTLVELPWKVIYVASRQEKKTEELLSKIQVACYLPLVKSLRQWSDRKKWVEVPLFNGYLFVQPKAAQRDLVLQIPSVVKYLQYNGADATLSLKELNTIKSVVEFGYDVSEFDPHQGFEKGDAVTVSQGPLKNFKGQIIRLGADDYALIHFDNFGHVLKIKLPKQILKKIGQ